jgi:hypothetical protein
MDIYNVEKQISKILGHQYTLPAPLINMAAQSALKSANEFILQCTAADYSKEMLAGIVEANILLEKHGYTGQHGYSITDKIENHVDSHKQEIAARNKGCDEEKLIKSIKNTIRFSEDGMDVIKDDFNSFWQQRPYEIPYKIEGRGSEQD